MNFKLITLFIALMFGIFWVTPGTAQTNTIPESTQYLDTESRLWINTYGNIQLNEKFFWIAQTHFRFSERNNTPFAGRFAQLYARHAIGYLHSKNLNLALGGVVRLNFNPATNTDDTQRNMVPEWRIWHQYQFAMPLDKAMVYHRFRIEHRWSRGFNENSETIFRNRWRYMFNIKIPINSPTLSPETFYVAPEAEIIMQSGKAVVNSPMEDLRLHTSFGYIVNPRLTVAAGLMYSMGQQLDDGAFFNQKWTLRFHIYFSPDFGKIKSRFPSIKFMER